MNTVLDIYTDSLKDALLHLRSVLHMDTNAMVVLHWLCTKEKDGQVVVDAEAYRKELKMSRQSFSNNIVLLRAAGLISKDERGVFRISSLIPRSFPATFTINFKPRPHGSGKGKL